MDQPTDSGPQQQLEKIVTARRSKNLDFFKAEFPSVYQKIIQVEFSPYQLNLTFDGCDADLLIDNQPVYRGSAKKVACGEVAEFCKVFTPGSKLNSVASYDRSSFSGSRFFLEKAHKVVQQDVFNQLQFDGYIIPDFYPLVVFFGSGLGYQIVELVNKAQVHHIVVAETDITKFALSLFCIDWSDLYYRFFSTRGRSLGFVLGLQSDELFYSGVMQKLREYVPLWPATTLFFNHLGDQNNRRVVDKINGDILQVPYGWGNYDDEVNQINCILHNYYLHVKPIADFKKPLHSCVIVVGSGPSLNGRFADLKIMQRNATIISCGTALRSLYTHGIKPDIHIQIESNPDTKVALQYIGDDEWLRDINFVALAQVNPYVFQLFDKTRICLKNYGAAADLFKNIKTPFIPFAGPTVVNGGIALATYYQPQAIFLFGVDFGFKSLEEHHADGSMYELNHIEKNFKNDVDYRSRGRWLTRAADGGEIETDPVMFLAKLSLESLIESPENKNIQFFNCSAGIEIKNAKLINTNEDYLNFVVNHSSQNEKRLADVVFQSDDDTNNLELIELALKECSNKLDLIVRLLQTELEIGVHSQAEITALCYRLNIRLIAAESRDNTGSLALIQGSIRQFLYALFTFCFMAIDDSARLNYYQLWLIQFSSFLNGVKQNFDAIVFKEFALEADNLVLNSYHKD